MLNHKFSCGNNKLGLFIWQNVELFTTLCCFVYWSLVVRGLCITALGLVGMFIFWFYSKYSIIIGNFIVYKECIYYINFCTYSMKINMYTYIKKCMYYIHSVLNCFIHSQTREGEFTGIFTHIHCLVHFMITCFLLTFFFFFSMPCPFRV